MSPTQRTLKAMKEQGRICGIVERFNAHVGPHGIRQDLFGFIDIVCIRADAIVGIQATSGSNGAARVTKIQTERQDELRAWLAAGGLVEVWAWRKYATRVDGKLWRPKVTRVHYCGRGKR